MRDHINVSNVIRLLSEGQNLLTMREVTVVRDPLSVRNVGRPLAVAQNLVGTRKFILVRNPTNVSNVGRPLFVAHTLVSTNKLMQNGVIEAMWEGGEAQKFILVKLKHS